MGRRRTGQLRRSPAIEERSADRDASATAHGHRAGFSHRPQDIHQGYGESQEMSEGTTTRNFTLTACETLNLELSALSHLLFCHDGF